MRQHVTLHRPLGRSELSTETTLELLLTKALVQPEVERNPWVAEDAFEVGVDGVRRSREALRRVKFRDAL